jgi:hypothetical protein
MNHRYPLGRIDLFQTANGFYPVAVSLRQYNTQIHKSHTQYTYIIHTITHITQNNTTKTNKPNKEKQISSQSYTNSEGDITANEYSVEKREEIKLSLIQALEAYRVVRHQESLI